MIGSVPCRLAGTPRWLRFLACLVAMVAGGYFLLDQLLWGASGDGMPGGMVDAPKSMQTLSSAIQGKTNRMIRWAILWRYGRADRDIGSGVPIEQWDLPEGILTMQGRGPSFTENSTQRIWHLLKSENPLGRCLLQSYEMRAAPNGGAWLRQMDLRQDMTYHFKRQEVLVAGSVLPRFLMDHPKGRIEIIYEPGITAETLLETLPEDAPVARVTFMSSEGAESVSFPLVFSSKHRVLVFDSEKPFPFHAWTGMINSGVTHGWSSD